MPNEFIYRALPSHQQIPCPYEGSVGVPVCVDIYVVSCFAEIWLIICTRLFVIWLVQPTDSWSLGFHGWPKIVIIHDDRKNGCNLIHTLELIIWKENINVIYRFCSNRTMQYALLRMYCLYYHLTPTISASFDNQSRSKLYYPAHFYIKLCLHLKCGVCSFVDWWAPLVCNENNTFEDNNIKNICKFSNHHLINCWYNFSLSYFINQMMLNFNIFCGTVVRHFIKMGHTK